MRVRVVNTDNALDGAVGHRRAVRRAAVDGTDLHGPAPVDRPCGSDRRRPGRPGGHRSARRRPRRLRRHHRAGARRRPHRRRPAPRATEFVDLLSYGAPASTGLDLAGRTGCSTTASAAGSASSTAVPGRGGRSTATCSPTSRCSWSTKGDVVVMRIDNHSGASHPMHLHGHHALVLSPRWRDVHRLPVVGRLARGRRRRDLRDRVRRRQPRHLDGPLPQPAACRGRAGGPPDVRRSLLVVPRRRFRQPTRVARRQHVALRRAPRPRPLVG